MKKKWLPYSKFVEIYSLVSRLVVEVVIKNEDGYILTLREIEPYKGYWHLPGGTVLLSETLEMAVIRVAKDELDIKVEPQKLIGVIYYPSVKKHGGFGWTIGMAYQAKYISGKLKGSEQGEMVKAFKTIPAHTIPEQKRFLKDYKKW